MDNGPSGSFLAAQDTTVVVEAGQESAKVIAFRDGLATSLGGTAALAAAGLDLFPAIWIGLAAGLAYMWVRHRALS